MDLRPVISTVPFFLSIAVMKALCLALLKGQTSAEQLPRQTIGRRGISSKHSSLLESPLEPPTIIVPFASLYAVRNVKEH